MKKMQLYLMYIFPFLNVVNYRLGGFVVVLLTILFILVLLFTKGHRTKYKGSLKLKHFIFWGLFFLLVEIISSFIFDIDNIDFIRFYFLFLLINPFLYYKGDPMQFFNEHLQTYLKYVILLMASCIVVDFILLNVGLVHLQLMYNPELYTYLDRPFGLFGQPSVNSCLLCFFFLFYTAITNGHTSKSVNYKLLIVVIVGVVLQGSGSGFISLLILILALLTKGKNLSPNLFKLIFVSSILGYIVYEIIMSGVVEKVGIDYISYLYDYVLFDIIEPYKKLAKSASIILFGIPKCPLQIDFGPLFILGTVGLFGLVFILLFWLRLFLKTKSHYLKMGLLVLLVGNMHYPVMFYMLMHFIWFYIMYYIFVVEKNQKT